MQEWHLTLLIVASLTGAFLFAWKEAAMIVAGKDLNHFLLTVFRLSLALLAIALIPAGGDGRSLPQIAMLLLLMMGCFAPVHRTTLNVRRMVLGHRIQWHHMGKGWYDSLTSFLTHWPKTRFLGLCSIELIFAYAMYTQLTP